MSSRVEGLDGLRALAALMVLVSHSKLGSSSWGAAGVWLFFILSGYLLGPSLLANPSIKFFQSTTAFYIKRFFRIIPAYYTAVLLYSIFIWSNDNVFFDHVVFKEAFWLFWSVKTELFFYLFLPIIILPLILSKSINYQFMVLFCLFFITYYLFEKNSFFEIIAFQKNSNMRLYFLPFIIGIILSFIPKINHDNYSQLTWFLSFLGLFFLCQDFSFFSDFRESIGVPRERVAWIDRMPVYVLCAFLIYLSANNKNWLLNNRVIVSIGKSGYSFYLWHTFVLVMLRKNNVPDGFLLFISGLFFTTVIAYFSYRHIEIPTQIMGNRIADKIMPVVHN
ncbi:MAG: acyltransferase [Gammaproteobacteria bacterium]